MTTALGMGPGGGAAASWIYLMWTFDSQIPGQPTQGTVTGRVVRPTWPEGATAAVYVGVPDVAVWGKDASGEDLVLNPNPLLPPETVAKTDKDGRFTFYGPALHDGDAGGEGAGGERGVRARRRTRCS